MAKYEAGVIFTHFFVASKPFPGSSAAAPRPSHSEPRYWLSAPGRRGMQRKLQRLMGWLFMGWITII